MPTVTVRLFGIFRETSYGKKIDKMEMAIYEGETIRDLLAEVSKIFMNFHKIFYQTNDEMTKTRVWIFINGKNLWHLNDKLDTKLKDGDIVSIVPAVAGG